MTETSRTSREAGRSSSSEDRSRLRVTLLTDAYLPHAGGSRVYYHNLFSRLAQMGHDVEVLTTKVSGWRSFDEREQTHHYTISRHFQPLRDLSYSQLAKIAGPLLITFWRFLLRRPDVLHCGDLYPSAVVGLFWKKLFRIPMVAYCHGEDITLTNERRFQPKLRNLIYRSADAVVANGDFAIGNLLRLGVARERIHKLTPGLDPAYFHPEVPNLELRARYGLGDGLVVATIARLVTRKGHARVLRALAALRDKIPPTKYLIAGRGPAEAELRRLTEDLGLTDQVVFAGFVPDEALNQHYNLADLLAMPNTAEAGDVEGFGMVFLEANAAGKPVIGGRSGGTAEAVADGQTGMLVSSEDDAELRDALERLLNDRDLRERMGAAGLRRVTRDFAWATRAEALERVSYLAANAASGVPTRQHRAAEG